MRFFLAATVALGALASAGCGGGSLSAAGNGGAAEAPKQVLADAVKAAKAATFVHVSGHLPAGFHRETLDLTLKVGEGATGSFTIDGPGGPQKVDLVVIGLGTRMPCPQCKSYMRANAAFW